MIVEFFGGGRWFAVSLGADDREEIFLFGQVVEAVLFEAYQPGLDAFLFGPGDEVGGQFLGVSRLGAIGNGYAKRAEGLFGSGI